MWIKQRLKNFLSQGPLGIGGNELCKTTVTLTYVFSNLYVFVPMLSGLVNQWLYISSDVKVFLLNVLIYYKHLHINVKWINNFIIVSLKLVLKFFKHNIYLPF